MNKTTKCLALMIAGAIYGCAGTGTGKVTGVTPEPNRLAQLNTQMAVEYMRHGDNETALKKLQKALDYDRNNTGAHNTLGILYSRLGQNDQAEKHFNAALRSAPQDSDTLNNYGQFLCRAKRSAEALPLFDRALANPLYDTPAVAATNAGLCAYQNGDLAAADKYLRGALSADDKFATALLLMARVAFEQHQALSARGYLQRYAEVGTETAQSLGIGMRVERELGNRDAEASYALALRTKFPDSAEARDLIAPESQ